MLYIMRHGKTDWNDKHKLQGTTDIPLNDEGRRMAEEAAREYRFVHLDVCYCSPLSRAKETAEIFLRDRRIELKVDDRLREMGFGIYEGAEDPRHMDGSPIQVFFEHPEQYKGVEGGETLKEVMNRISGFLEEEINPLLKCGQDVLLIGHGAVNSCIACKRNHIPLERFWETNIENCKMLKMNW